MYTLFLDTHDESVVVAIYKDGVTIAVDEIQSSRDHCSNTMPAIDAIIKKCNITINDIKEIIVVNGPGSFTGVRIGVTIAKTFAMVLNIPIKTISCLEIYAISNNKGFGKLIAVKDPKGFYFVMFNQKNEMMWDNAYLPTDKFNQMVKDKNLSRMLISDNFEYDIDIIYDFCKNKPCLNPHEVNPLYIKSIEVNNG